MAADPETGPARALTRDRAAGLAVELGGVRSSADAPRGSPVHGTRLRRNVGDRLDAPSAPLHDPNATLLRCHPAVEEALDDLPMCADQGGLRKLCEESSGVAARGVWREFLSALDVEPSRAGKRGDGFETPRVRARDDPVDRVVGERPSQVPRVRTSNAVEPASTIGRRRRQPLACACMSQQQHLPTKMRNSRPVGGPRSRRYRAGSRAGRRRADT